MKVKRQKRLIRPALFLSLLVFFFLPSLSESRVPPISAKSALIISLKDWQPLYDKSSGLRLPMASTTKIMTALLAVEYLQGDEYVLISENATTVQPVKLGLIEGARYRADDLLYGLLLYSANDAGVALAEKVAGTEERFVGLMNQKARDLGAMNTHFNNSTGLPGVRQYTTVSDLALILSNVLKHEKIVTIMQTRYTSIGHNGRTLILRNKNKLLWQCPWTVGGKTGFTRMAGHCYVGGFKNEENEFIVVLLGSKRLWADASALVDYGNRLLAFAKGEDSTPAPEVKKLAKKVPVHRKKIAKRASAKVKKTVKHTAPQSKTLVKSATPEHKKIAKKAAHKIKKITKRATHKSKKIVKKISKKPQKIAGNGGKKSTEQGS
jgi:D-alanyl-D-alanine carboxypeptidase (penicillin-binding protein 5/6)